VVPDVSDAVWREPVVEDFETFGMVGIVVFEKFDESGVSSELCE
jgi:hypothetical protein